MNLKELLAAAIKAAQSIAEGAVAEKRDLTADEYKEIEALEVKIADLRIQLERAEKSDALVARVRGLKVSDREPEPKQDAAQTIGERFVASAAFRGFKAAYPSGVGTGSPVNIDAKGVGGLDDLGIGYKVAGTVTTATGQPAPSRLPGYGSNLIDEPTAFLDLITTGSTAASWIEYAQITAETNGAAVVAEGALKPLSDVTTVKAEAKAFTYADGFDITNQQLADDGSLAAFLDSRIRWHVRNKVEDVLLNGDAGSAIKGILNTTGVQAQAFVTDVITTLAAALQKVEARQVVPEAIVMNPADAWGLSLLKGSDGHFLLGNPLQQSLNPTPFGVKLVKSNRVAVGTAVVGNFSGVQFLEREPLSVMAFNQHKDYAQRNMTYVRAEMRGLQFIYAPADLVIADLTA